MSGLNRVMTIFKRDQQQLMLSASLKVDGMQRADGGEDNNLMDG